MKTQLSQLMQTLDLTAAKFADEIGVQRSSISHILSGRNQPSYDFILKILGRFPEINAEWLITGTGDMHKGNETDKTSGSNVNAEEKSQGILPLFDLKERSIKSEPVDQTNRNLVKHDTVLNREVTNVNRLKKILVLYGDNTFEEFTERPAHT